MIALLRFTGVLACFGLSGFAALLYQTVWTRSFAFVFGTSELAVATVLAAYMGGLAGGAAIAARFVGRIRRPVLAYALLEFGIAASALAVPTMVDGATQIFLALFGGHPTPPASGGGIQAIYYLLSGFVILAIPTGLMGATLPMLAREAVRAEREIGAHVGLLYATNTAGAVAGTLAAAFVFLPALGQRETLWIGAAMNALAFAVAALLARTSAPILDGARPQADRSSHGTDRFILPAIALSGVASFTYEVLWTRLLGHLLGGSAYAFSTMLATFLVGISLGSLVASRLASSRARAIQAFAAAQLATAALSFAAFSVIDGLPELAVRLGAGWQSGLAANVALAGAVLLPSTLFIGATFPLAVRILARTASDASAASARVYAWNTFGAIAGALGAGFFLIPYLGYAGVLAFAVMANLALASLCALRASPRAHVLLGLTAAGVAVLALAPPETPWKLLRSSPFDPSPAPGEVRFLGVGRSATVLMLQSPGDPASWHLRSNGLPEATIDAVGRRAARSQTNAWLGALATLARPNARSMVVVGLGGGLAVESVPPSIERVDVIELEPEVVSANRSVADERRRDPLQDPRVHVVENDARGALLRTDARFDAIVSQPSHPWTAGASHLYTREFFDLVRDRLAPDGVFVQWIGLSFVDEPLLRSLLATLLATFPYVEVYRPEPGGLLFLSSLEPLDLGGTAGESIRGAPGLFATLGLHEARDVLRVRVLDDASARKLAAGAPINTDGHNLFEAMAPGRLRTGALRMAGTTALLGPLDPLQREIDAPSRLRDVRRLAAAGFPDRATQLAAGLQDPADRQVASGFVELALGREDRATALFGEALRMQPQHAEARYALLRSRRRFLPGGDARYDALERDLPPEQAAIAAGFRFEATGEADRLTGLESRLAAVVPSDPGYVDALRLRAAARLATGDGEAAQEGIELLDTAIVLDRTAAEGLLRLQLAAAAGYSLAAVSEAGEIAAGLARSPSPRTRETAEGIRAILSSLPLPAERSGDVEWILERLEGLGR